MPVLDSNDIRQLPFSESAEQALIGIILINPEALTDVADLLAPDDFYNAINQGIYATMKSLFDQNHTFDGTILVDELLKAGVFNKSEERECKDYLQSCGKTSASSQNAREYAKIIKEKHTLRQLIEAASDISDAAMRDKENVTNILDYAEKRIFDIANGRVNSGFHSLGEILRDVFSNLQVLATNPEANAGLPTGFSSLDKVLAGIGKSDLVLIGARPGMGKTSFALNIATNVAKQNHDKAIAIFSLEMGANQLVERVLSSEALVDSYSIRTGKLTPEEWTNLAHACDSLYGLNNVLIDDTSGQTVTAIRAKLRRIRQPLAMVIIDYLQLMQGETHTDNRVQEVADISRSLKILAKDMDCPVLCCAQLSRGPESRTEKRPMLSDLRDSGAIEQDADIVMFLYRPEYYNTSDKETPNSDSNIAEVIVAKNRHGATDKIQMGWIPRFTKFRSLADNELAGAVPPAP
ncbi:MAG: replicative DNA helicase [Clostridia bacterium]|nr:replicative DNA helicase [Clostridia bacterium]